MKTITTYLVLVTIFIVMSSAHARIAYPRDCGDAIEVGSAIKICGEGTIEVCDDNDFGVIGIVSRVVVVSSVNYYEIENYGLALARIRADVSPGDFLTTAADGILRKANSNEVKVGVAVESGHATELRRIKLAPDYRTDFDTLANYAPLDTLEEYVPIDSLGAYLDTTYTGDNLGNHISEENLQMSGFWVSNDGGDEGLFVDSDGRVGVGTSTPGDAFEVVGGNGGILITGDNPALVLQHGGYVLGVSRPTGSAWSVSAGVNDLVLRSPNAEAVIIQSGDGTADIFIDPTHNIGIGTASPGAKLDINGTAIIRDVPADASPESVLTIDGGQVKKYAVADFAIGTALWADSASWAAFVDWDSIANIPADIADGDDIGFQQLRADGSAWLTDQATLVSGTNITLTQSNDTITIAASGGGGSDDDWTGAGTDQMYATYSDDSVAIGRTSATAKLDVQGGITMRGDRYRGTDATGADSFYIYDDGDTTRFDADNPIKIGDGSLIIANNGYVYATKNLYAGDSLYIGDVQLDEDSDKVLVVSDDGKVGYASLNHVGGAVTRAYGELMITSQHTYSGIVKTPNWQYLDVCECGITSGDPWITTTCVASAADTIIIGDEGAALFQLNVSISFSGPSGLRLVMETVRIATDGGLHPITKAKLYSDVTSAGQTQSSSLSGLIELQAGEKLVVRFHDGNSSGGARALTIVNFNLQVTRIDGD